MTDSDRPDEALSFTPRQLLEGAERELRHRQGLYPKMVAKGSMSPTKMRYELALMQAIIERLRALTAYAERKGE